MGQQLTLAGHKVQTHWPGPASTVEEHLLRNISSEGTAFKTRRGFLSFQTREIYRLALKV